MKRILILMCLPVWMLSPVKAQSTYQMAGPYEVVARDGEFRSSKDGSERDIFRHCIFFDEFVLSDDDFLTLYL